MTERAYFFLIFPIHSRLHNAKQYQHTCLSYIPMTNCPTTDEGLVKTINNNINESNIAIAKIILMENIKEY